MESLQSQRPSLSVSTRPRVIIVGAGMSGLSAAHRITSLAPGRFNLTILEASERAGGRLFTSTFCGERVEMGATWIHGIEGSPVHDIADRMGLMQGDIPWECMDGFPESPIVMAEGGLEVHSHIVNSVGDLYKKLYDQIQHTDGGLQQFAEGESGFPTDKLQQLKAELKGESVGAYLQEGLKMYLTTQEESLSNGHCNGHAARKPPTWTSKALQEGVFRMRENLERSVTAVESLNDLDLDSNDEYFEYPGEHKTIGKGYSSVVNFLASDLPEGTIQFSKKAKRISWLNPAVPVHIHCEDGSRLEADHVIITVSLGVLKADALGQQAKAPQFNNLFQPPLPPWKLDTISKLGFGVVDKCFLSMKPSLTGAIYPHMQLVFREEGWLDANGDHYHIPWWMRGSFSFYPIHKGSNVLCTWLTGKDALEMESLSNEEVTDGVVKSMEAFGFKERITGNHGVNGKANGSHAVVQDVRLNGGYTPQVQEISRSRWGSNPLFRGSYSYVAVGSSGKDIDILAEPLPKPSNDGDLNNSPLQLLFAGEATHRFCYSTTHGAFLSGAREAERLLKHYGMLNTD